MKTASCYIVLVIDEDGDYTVGSGIESAIESYKENVQDLDDVSGLRIFEISLKVPVPEIVKLSGEIPETHGAEITLTVSPNNHGD